MHIYSNVSILIDNSNRKLFKKNFIFTPVVPMDLDVKMKAMSLAALFLIVSFRFR